MKDIYNDPNEDASDFDFEDAEQIAFIKCEELRHLDKIAINAMFLVAHKMKPHESLTTAAEEYQRFSTLLNQAVLAYNEWLEKEKKNASNTDS